MSQRNHAKKRIESRSRSRSSSHSSFDGCRRSSSGESTDTDLRMRTSAKDKEKGHGNTNTRTRHTTRGEGMTEQWIDVPKGEFVSASLFREVNSIVPIDLNDTSTPFDC